MADLIKTKRDKAKSQGFSAFGIPVGSVLVFKKDPAITVKTLDDRNKVEYLGKPYSISTLAKQLVGSPVSGYLYFKFEGKVIKNLAKGEPKPAISESAEASASESAEEPVEVTETFGNPTDLGEAGVPGEFGRELDPLAGEAGEEPSESPEAGAKLGA
jgi:hypothetical protein